MEENAKNGKPPELGADLTDGFAGRFILKKVRSILRALRLPWTDHDDLAQQLRLELVARAQRFDPSRGTWEAFVLTVVNARARSLYRRLARTPRPISLEEAGCDGRPVGASVLADPAQTDPAAAFQLRLDVDDKRDGLDAERQYVLDQLKIWSVTELAEKLGIPRSTLDDRVKGLSGPLASLAPGGEPPEK